MTANVRDRAMANFDSDKLRAAWVEHKGRSFPLDSNRDAVNLGRALAALESAAQSGERLFVGPADLRRTNYNDAYIYYLVPQLRPASYFLEMNPLSANRPNSRLASDVASADWLLLTRQWDRWNEPNESMAFGSSAPLEIVRTQFKLIGQFGAYEIHRRQSPVASRN